MRIRWGLAALFLALVISGCDESDADNDSADNDLVDNDAVDNGSVDYGNPCPTEFSSCICDSGASGFQACTGGTWTECTCDEDAADDIRDEQTPGDVPAHEVGDDAPDDGGSDDAASATDLPVEVDAYEEPDAPHADAVTDSDEPDLADPDATDAEDDLEADDLTDPDVVTTDAASTDTSGVLDTGPAVCAAIENEYLSLTSSSGSQDCGGPESCHVLYGHCGVGLGGCHYGTNVAITQADLDALAARWVAADCDDGRPVCRCTAPPGVRCDAGGCLLTAPL